MWLINLFMSIVGAGVQLVMVVMTIVLALIAGGIASYKHRSGLFWGLVVLMFPWAIIAIPFLPRKYPKFSPHIKNLDAFKGKNPVVAAIMALSAIVAKSDGAVTKEEIDLVKQFVTRSFGISGEELKSYGDAFNYGKEHPEEYKEFTNMIRSYANIGVIQAIAYLLIGLGLSGDNLSEAKEESIRKILQELGVSEYDYRSIKGAYTNQGNYSNYQGGGSYYGNQAPQDLTKQYTEVLGVSEDASMNEIKKAYRKLVKEYHPDKLASESMPPDYVEFANKKIIEINAAYEYLKKSKEV